MPYNRVLNEFGGALFIVLEGCCCCCPISITRPSTLKKGHHEQKKRRWKQKGRMLQVSYTKIGISPSKCMVHGAGGTLLQHLKEHLLHVDLQPDERLFYFTTCGWMMWNWLVSALAAGALTTAIAAPIDMAMTAAKGRVRYRWVCRSLLVVRIGAIPWPLVMRGWLRIHTVRAACRRSIMPITLLSPRR